MDYNSKDGARGLDQLTIPFAVKVGFEVKILTSTTLPVDIDVDERKHKLP